MSRLPTAIVYLQPEGARFHPGPLSPEQVEGAGIVRLTTLQEVQRGAGVTLAHPDVHRPIDISSLFGAARAEFEGIPIEVIDIYVDKSELDRWTLQGSLVLPPIDE